MIRFELHGGYEGKLGVVSTRRNITLPCLPPPRSLIFLGMCEHAVRVEGNDFPMVEFYADESRANLDVLRFTDDDYLDAHTKTLVDVVAKLSREGWQIFNVMPREEESKS